jgi:hypothetical protein
MPAGVWNFTIEVASTFARKLTLKNKITNEPVNLTGYKLWMHFRNVNSGALVLATSLETGHWTANLATGEIFLEISPEETFVFNSLPQVIHSLLLESPTGRRTRLLQGVARISPPIVYNV